jgi:hypothetical protein
MTTLADSMLNAVEDARRLVSWAEPNSAVLDESPVEARLLDALASTGTSPDTAFAVPMLHFCDPDVQPVSLLQAVVFDKRTATTCCERCESNAGGTERLLVPMGSSVVALHCCFHCRDVLTDCYNVLVWG